MLPLSSPISHGQMLKVGKMRIDQHLPFTSPNSKQTQSSQEQSFRHQRSTSNPQLNQLPQIRHRYHECRAKSEPKKLYPLIVNRGIEFIGLNIIDRKQRYNRKSKSSFQLGIPVKTQELQNVAATLQTEHKSEKKQVTGGTKQAFLNKSKGIKKGVMNLITRDKQQQINPFVTLNLSYTPRIRNPSVNKLTQPDKIITKKEQKGENYQISLSVQKIVQQELDYAMKRKRAYIQRGITIDQIQQRSRYEHKMKAIRKCLI